MKGGWHSNDVALRRDTGIDLHEFHYTYGYITEQDGTVVYEDTEWVVGDFYRITKLCQEMVNKSGVPLRYTCHTDGGSIESIIRPELDNYEKELQ